MPTPLRIALDYLAFMIGLSAGTRIWIASGVANMRSGWLHVSNDLF